MKKIYTNKIALVLILISGFNISIFAQNQVPYAEGINGPVLVNPGSAIPGPVLSPQSMWDIRFQFEQQTAAGTLGVMAGVAFINGEWWASRWSADSIYTFDGAGNFLSTFTIPGVGSAANGVRAFTTDGTFLYAATNGTNLAKIDPVTQTFVSSIPMPALTGGTNTTVRWATYDPTLDGGAGGFWIGNFNTDVLTVDMTGAQLLPSIAAGIHGLTAMYGAVVDNLTAGGPFLWVNNQIDPLTGTDSTDVIVQLDITSQSQTGVTHDVNVDLGLVYGALAGGITIATIPGFSDPSLIALAQSNATFAYEFLPLSVNELSKEIQLSLYPNPSRDNININLNKYSLIKGRIEIINSLGQEIKNISITNSKNKIDISDLREGIYTVKVISENKNIAIRKLIKQ